MCVTQLKKIDHSNSIMSDASLTPQMELRSAGEAVAEQIRRRVREETSLTCSCGIGPNRLLSKIATDMRKPDGQFAVGCDHAAIHRFIDRLPVRKIPGIGKVGCPTKTQLVDVLPCHLAACPLDSDKASYTHTCLCSPM